MIIQGSSSIISVYSANTKSAVKPKTSPAPAIHCAENTRISSEGKTLSAKESKPVFTQKTTYNQVKLLQAASSDRPSAENIAHNLSNTHSTIFFDISDQLGADNSGASARKLSTTGEIVSDDYINKFRETASKIDVQRLSIYETEKKKELTL